MRIRGSLLGLGRALAAIGLTANILTVVGLLLNVAVALVIAFGHPRWGGGLLMVASAFDMLDGAVARATGTITRFGGFLDSTLDRYSEAVVFGGVLVYLLGTDDADVGAILVFVATVGALLISYARARAEAAGYGASVGLVARPERVVLLAVCLLIDRPLWALWFLAITTHLTALTRILHVQRLAAVEASDAASRPTPPVPAASAPNPERR
ncbi:MAG: Phosphatidylinositol phosphate synthase @ Archaetidylinositol phosphate synthase [uncultured Thermomicrobiales bacterium]|uniref:Phosphatidylinositol phosphate synthase @ Archaetidylinositol phosphate synthase n=1 Tax=uncultured Thermomicrobiales bacterium TaxID=1645740 RepID=A0A6J4U6T4_9BACT|nr:MAG: Phosphatidylinositol phosphate synthase @ Archaetidylinositol phosphate synthase [uncultured Thermomicrobiales bacterium]